MIRIAQQNDWVVFILIGCIFLYICMLISLRRDSTVLEFLTQKFADSTNNYLSWIIISVVFSIVFAVFLSFYVPTVPQKVSEIKLSGYELNNFGFTFLTVGSFYFVKNILTYIFFAGTGSIKKWQLFYFTASKFYFCFSLVVMILCIVNSFYTVDQLQMSSYCFIGFSLIFLFKLLYYLFHNNGILPEAWYYKFLYICTLQIIPVLVLWKVLFF